MSCRTNGLRRDRRIAAEVVIGEHDLPRGDRLFPQLSGPSRRGTGAEPRLPRGQLQLAGVEAEPEITTPQIELLPGQDRPDCAAAVAVGRVDPVVESPYQPVVTRCCWFPR